jgi:hypothetical protein
VSSNDTIDPNDWLSKAETLWRPKLESVGLVTEFLNENRLAQKAAKAFGLLSSSSPTYGIQALKRFPAANVVAFTGVAIDAYEGGSFWPGFSDSCGYQIAPLDQKAWGDSYLRSLRILGLPTFPELPKKYLGTILVHAGIPNYCLSDFFLVLEKGMRNVGSDPEAIVQWAVQRENIALQGIDIPVVRFLKFGKEYAVDFVDQALDALISLSRDPDSTPESQAPERVINAARDFLESNAVRASFLRSGITRRKPTATIRLNPYSGELDLLLPGLEDSPAQFAWTVNLDGTIKQTVPLIRVRGNSYSADETILRIDQPTRVISVKNKQIDFDYETKLVDEKDPIIFFTEEGQRISSFSSLPGARLWVLFAVQNSTVKPDFDSLIIRTEIPPLGWVGWQLALVDMTDQEKVRLTAQHPYHSVKTQTNASIELVDEISWLSFHGSPLQTARPIAHLPDNISADWRVQVLDLKTNRVILNRVEKSHSHKHDTFDPFEGIAAPILGHFEIAIKGPYGRGAKRQIAIAEGLTTSEKDPWRVLSPLGLSPISVRLVGNGLTSEPHELHLPSTEVITQVCISHEHAELTLVAQPPSMAVATLTKNIANRWNFGFVRIDSSDVSQATLMLRTNLNSQNPSLRATAHDKVIQYIDPASVEKSGYATYSLAGLTDSLRDKGALDLFIYYQDQPIRVARIEPKKVASGAQILDNLFTFIEFAGGDVEVRFWPVMAPWLGPESALVDSGGDCPIPEALVGHGSLLASWRRIDPWIPHQWTALPAVGQQVILEVEPDPGVSSATTLALAQVAIAERSANPGDAWKILEMATHLNYQGNWAVINVLTESLRSNPDDALMALANSDIPNENRVKLLIQSGVLWSQNEDLNEGEVDGRTLQQLYDQDPKIASLYIIPKLMTSALTPEHIELWRMLQNQHGNPLTEILTESNDKFHKAGSFAGAAHFDVLPTETQETIIQESQLLPNATIDGDSRTQAAWMLFQKKKKGSLVDAARDGRTRLDFQLSIYRDWHWDQATKSVESRRDPDHKGGWLSLSAQSISFALTAAVGAQGELHAQTHLKENIRHWLSLAKHAPDLVYADLILARCLAADQFSQFQPKNPLFQEVEQVEEEEDE